MSKMIYSLSYMITAGLSFLASSDMPDCGQNYDRHVVGYGTIQLTSGSELSLSYDEISHVIPSEPTFWAAYPGPRIRFCSKDRWHHRHLAFTGPKLLEWEQTGLWPFNPCPARQWSEAFALLQHQSQGSRIDRLSAINSIERLLIEIASATAECSTRSEWLSHVISEMQHGFAPDYKEIGESVGMAESTLRRRFHEEMGVSIHHYKIEQRIAEARRQLIETNLPLHKVAEDLGYGNEFFFARQFRQWTGVTPGMYRKSRE